jgi:hypothetical protein
MNPLYTESRKFKNLFRIFPFTFLLLTAVRSSAQFTQQSSSTFPNASFNARNVIADFDKDGDADILFQTGGNGTSFSYARNNGNGTFTTVAQSASPFSGVTLPDVTAYGVYRTADFDGDGYIDIWIPANAGTGTFFKNNAGTFASASSSTFPNPSFSVRTVIADFDKDGDADILYQTGGNGTAFMYGRSNGDGTFTLLAQSASPFSGVTLPDIGAYGSYRTADFDGDGDIDIWVPANAGTGTYFRNDAGTFVSASSSTFPAPSFSARAVESDFDHDGKADILFQTGGNGTSFSYAKSNGNGTFTTVAQSASPFSGLTLPDITVYGAYRAADFHGPIFTDIWVPVNSATGTYFMQTGSLPLYWLSLNAVFANDQVNITWKTTDELNTSYFSIERSTDGVSYSSLGQVASANSPGEHLYAYNDKSVQQGYTYYYRIKQVDIDGRYSYSSILRVNTGGDKTASLKVRNNPVQADLVLSITLPEAQNAKLVLINQVGATVLERKQHLQAGETITTLRTSNLPKGVYYLVVYAGKDKLRSALIKQ